MREPGCWSGVDAQDAPVTKGYKGRACKMTFRSMLPAGSFRKAWLIVLAALGVASLLSGVFEALQHGRVWIGALGLLGGLGLFWVAYMVCSMFKAEKYVGSVNH
jgi:hypothetical protein